MPVEPVNEIGTNRIGLVLARILNDNTLLLQNSLQRLTTGLRIISPADDAAGLAQSVKINNEMERIGGVLTVLGNVGSFVDTQTDFLADVSTSLSRMRELAVANKSASTTASQRSANQAEFLQLQQFISDIGNRNFNNIALFNGVDLRGVKDENGGTFTVNGINYTTTFGGGGLFDVYQTTLDITATAGAITAEASVSTASSNLTALQGRAAGSAQVIDLYEGALTDQSENLQAVRDRILNVDSTAENEEFSRLSLLTQTGTTLIARYNLLRENLLTLFE